MQDKNQVADWLGRWEPGLQGVYNLTPVYQYPRMQIQQAKREPLDFSRSPQVMLRMGVTANKKSRRG